MCNTIKSRQAGSIQEAGGEREQVESDRTPCRNRSDKKTER